jgi:hypothetical protein
MCDVPNISSVYPYNTVINHKVFKQLNNFLKRHSGNNIITVIGIKKQAYVVNSNLNVRVNDRLIIECHCVNYSTFKNENCIEAMVNSVFNPLIGVSDIKLVYSYSMYYCRD